jgi:hypothetical protein
VSDTKGMADIRRFCIGKTADISGKRVMIRRRSLVFLGSSIACAAALLSAPSAATAATATSASVAPAAIAQTTWHDTGQSFFLYTSCDAAGQAGVTSGWETFDCKGGIFKDYELWGLW